MAKLIKLCRFCNILYRLPWFLCFFAELKRYVAVCYCILHFDISVFLSNKKVYDLRISRQAEELCEIFYS